MRSMHIFIFIIDGLTDMLTKHLRHYINVIGSSHRPYAYDDHSQTFNQYLCTDPTRVPPALISKLTLLIILISERASLSFKSKVIFFSDVFFCWTEQMLACPIWKEERNFPGRFCHMSCPPFQYWPMVLLMMMMMLVIMALQRDCIRKHFPKVGSIYFHRRHSRWK